MRDGSRRNKQRRNADAHLTHPILIPQTFMDQNDEFVHCRMTLKVSFYKESLLGEKGWNDISKETPHPHPPQNDFLFLSKYLLNPKICL